MADNTVNSDWHLAHNGNRCPINDTPFVRAYPFALGSQDPLWAEGSINRAVKSHLEFSGGSYTQQDADAGGTAGTLSLLTLRKYIDFDLLYGFQGGSRGKRPYSLLELRGYPTVEASVTVNFEAECLGCNRLNIDGTDSGTDQDNYLNWTIIGSINKPVSYDVYFDIDIEEIGTQYGVGNYRFYIPSGQTVAAQASIQATIGTFVNLTDNKLWFSSKRVSGENTINVKLYTANYGSILTHWKGDVFASHDVGNTCVDPTWDFAIGGLYDGNINAAHCGDGTLEGMYQNPTTQNRYAATPAFASMSQSLGTTFGNPVQAGATVKLGNMTVIDNCVVDTVVDDLAGVNYLVKGTIIDYINFRVDEIYKVTDGVLDGHVVMTSPDTLCP